MSNTQVKKNPFFKNRRNLILLVAIVLLLCIIAVLFIRQNHSTHFAQGTKIDGIDVSGTTVEEAAELLRGKAQDYQLRLSVLGKSYSLSASELNLQYNDQSDLQALKDQQNREPLLREFTVEDLYIADASFLLPQLEKDFPQAAEPAAEAGTEETGTEGAQEATDSSLVQAQEGTNAQEAAPKKPVNAYIIYNQQSQAFEIVPDTVGSRIDYNRILSQVQAAAAKYQQELSLEQKNIGEQAAITAENTQLQTALAEMNSYLSETYTYTFTPKAKSTSRETIDKDTMGKLLMVDTNLKVQVNREALGELIAAWGTKHSLSMTRPFVTHGGTTLDISVTTPECTVDQGTLFNNMIADLQDRKSGTHKAPYVKTGETNADSYWGGNYVEIDLTNQCLYLYKNGDCILSAPIVSGNVSGGYGTPTGNYTIFAMYRDTVLQGTNSDGSSYASPVSFFIPFCGGIGMHDASWRSSFGGDIYLYGGSHGCINMRYSDVSVVYDNVDIGTHVIVYGGAYVAYSPPDEGSGGSEPSPSPSPTPTPTPTPEPTAEPTPEPTAEPTPEPTAEPTPEPTVEPTPDPTPEPSGESGTGS